MALTPGSRVGPYEILAPIGAGGMGEVYRARDIKLRREVAIKTLLQNSHPNEEQVARFRREAELLAALHHANVATVYGLEEQDGQLFIVMELVEGETLAERIARGPIPLNEALPLFVQIASGLEAAHEKGIIHRDLKPANIKISGADQVKILDFGLAKTVSTDGGTLDISHSPTVTKDTALGAIMGTASYMSPEQARGKAIDKRTDIWAFACCLFEALTGRKAFDGETVSDIIASILARDPDWEALPERTPVKCRDLLRRCLRREPERRLHDIADARIEIEELHAEPASVLVVTPFRGGLPLLVAAFAAAIVAGIAVWSLLGFGQPVPRVVSRFDLNLRREEALTWMNDPSVAWSSDGSRLVYAGGSPTKLYVRPIDRMEATLIPGTDGTTPFLSPDGQWVGFYGQGKLQKVHLGGGLPIALCDVLEGVGASWGDDDTILFASTGTTGLSRISASGGAPSAVTTPDPNQGEISHRFPEFLPGAKAALFTIWTGSVDTSRIAVLVLETGEYRVLIDRASFAQYSATGHIVYARGRKLEAAPFDLDSLEVTGLPVPLSLDVRTLSLYGTAHFTLSRDGSLAYVPATGPPERTLTWVDRNGWTRPLTEARRAYDNPRFSPDGKRLAVTIETDRLHIWVYDLERGTLSRLSSGPEDREPIWTPDGERITFLSGVGPFDIVLQAADGSVAAERLTSLTLGGEPNSWSPDGKWLAFTEVRPASLDDISLLSLEGERKVHSFLQTPAVEAGGVFSPDGRWIAYNSLESGRLEVYVQPFPGPGGKWQVSTEGGSQAVWDRNGREIFYRNGDKVMAVKVETEPAFRLSKPIMLFEGRYEGAAAWGYANYDVAPDGHFLMIRSEKESAPTRIHVVLNWAEELKRLVPADK